MLHKVLKIALAKFPLVLVLPLDEVKQSPIPAKFKTFLDTGEATNPVPLGAGINLTLIDPHFPLILKGTVCALPNIFPQYPLRIGWSFNLASAMAPYIIIKN